MLHCTCKLDLSGTEVADFGLSEDVYSVNYYRQRKCSDDVEAKVPMRWMLLESIEDGLYKDTIPQHQLYGTTCFAPQRRTSGETS